MDLTAAGTRYPTDSGAGSGSLGENPRRRARALWPLVALWLGACAAAPPPIDTPGPVLDANRAVTCPHGTAFAAGQTQGRLSAVWCERADGRRHGPYVEWWENHQKKGAGMYHDGMRDGVWTFFGQDGQRDSQIEYRNGEAVKTP